MKLGAKRTANGTAADQSAKERKAGRKTVLDFAPRAEFSRERLADGVWERAASVHPDGRGGIVEAVSVKDLAAMAGGAALLFKRGSVSREQLQAAAWLRSLKERSEATGRSLSDLRERVDGGKMPVGAEAGMAQASAVSAYLAAFDGLSASERAAVNAVVVDGLSLTQAAAAHYAPEWSGVTREKTRRLRVLEQLRSGLDKVGAIGAWSGWA